MENIEIINAGMSHFEEVYDLLSELEGDLLDRQALYQVYANNLTDKDIYYFLAVCDSEIIGFASLHVQQLLHHASKVGELQEIIIRKSKRGLGIGNRLFDYVKKICKEKGCSQLEVCCNQKRRESHKFYLKQGMQNSHFKFTLDFD